MSQRNVLSLWPSKFHRRSAGCVVLIIFLACPFARAQFRTSYDLDSLAFLASDIVEGRVESTTFRITAVHAGALNVGDDIPLPNLDAYRKAARYSFRGSPLGTGDRLILFLARASDGGSKQSSPDDSLKLVGSGVRLIWHGCVYSFLPYMSPGPCVAITNKAAHSGGLTPLRSFRSDIAISIAKASKWHSHFAAMSGAPDIPWLLELLKEPRGPEESWYLWGDAVGLEAANRLAKTGNLAAIEEGIFANRGHAWPLFYAFDSPEGTNFLLSELSKPSLPDAHRRLLVSALDQSGSSAATRPAEDPRRPASYFTRIAALAVQNAQSQRACAAIVEMLRKHVSSARQMGQPPEDAELDQCAMLLGALYRQRSTPDQLKYLIEQTVAELGDAQYATLSPKAGSIASLARPFSCLQSSPQSVPEITLECEYNCLHDDHVTSVSLVFQAADGNASYETPSRILLTSSRGTSGVEFDCVPLPRGMRPGKFHVFYRFRNGTQIVSDGDGFDVSLPPPPVVWPQRPGMLWSPSRWPRTIWVSLTYGLIASAALLILRLGHRSLRKRLRFRRGLCIGCGYDIRASHGCCSECGLALPQMMPTGTLKRWTRRASFSLSTACLAATLALWPISYRSGQCLSLATSKLAGSIYITRGNFVIENGDRAADSSLVYDHGDPAVFPRSADEAGALTGWRMLGAEFSPDAGIAVVPCWIAAIIFALSVNAVRFRCQKF